MTALQQLDDYLRSLQRRMRLLAGTRGLALTVLLALLLTMLLVWIANRFNFGAQLILPLRVVLFGSISLAVAALLIRPLSLLTRSRVLRTVEKSAPDFQQRLLTINESKQTGGAWTELLAEDALQIAGRHPVGDFTPDKEFYLFGTAAIAGAAVLLWLIVAAPGYWGYGSGLLWTGAANPAKRPVYDIAVVPGNKTIRRKTDQLITAQLNGFSSDHASLYVKYGASLKWEKAPMQRTGDGDTFHFLFAGLSDKVEYYVSANRAASKHFTLNVKDLPAIRRVRVALTYPTGLGLENVTLDPSGDIRAVVGTKAEISVLTDRPLEQGQLVLNNGKALALTRKDGNWLSATLPIDKDGAYHFAAVDDGQSVRISDDYIIEAKPDDPPSVKIAKPGRDPHVSPIEELPVTVMASDDYGIQGLDLHYSVNGGPEQNIPLLKSKGQKEVEGKTTLYFENLKVTPGDMVSFYATARDARTTAHSELSFAQAEPFDFQFTQSQQAGGGGGGGAGNQSDEISQKQKQVIAATFNELQDKSKSHAMLLEDGKFLAEVQGKLGAQARTLSERMGSRDLAAPGSQFAQFSQLMTQASADMNGAADQLKPGKWSDALAPEQKALTSLLRAEALFRQIQVAYGQMGGGGGGGSAGRDLARMFDLEMDTSKNQYETGQSAQPDAGQAQSKTLDEAFAKLQQLARRQQELAAQNAQQQAVEQRWEEEQLRREAEELRQQLQKLAQNSQSQSSSSQGSASPQRNSQQASANQPSSGSSQGSSSGSQSGQSGQRSTESLQRETLERAGNSLNEAEEQMRKAAGGGDQAARQRAANQLREAQDQIRQMMRNQAGESIDQMSKDAARLAGAQKSLADRMKQLYGAGSGRRSLRETFGRSFPDGNGEGMPEMNDPNSRRFSYGFRRPLNPLQTGSAHVATDDETAIATDKEKVAAQLEQLEKQMQEQSRNLAAGRPDASSKLSRALSDAEGKELALRMQKNAEWIRQGYGDRNLQMEDSVTSGMQQLSRDLQGVRDALNGAGPNGQRNSKAAQALAEVQQLREQLQKQQQQQSGPGQGGEGGSGEASQAQARSGRSGTGSRDGSDSPTFGGGGRDVQQTIHQLYALRSQVSPNDRALYGSIDGALGNLQHLTGAQAGLLDQRINADTVGSLQRLEAELNRRLGQEETTGTRTGAPESSPEKYREAVAGYFRKLSQSHP